MTAPLVRIKNQNLSNAIQFETNLLDFVVNYILLIDLSINNAKQLKALIF